MPDLAKMFSELSPIGKSLFIAAFACLLLAFMDRLILGPILTEMKVMDAEIEAKKETVRRNLRIISFNDKIVDEYHQYRDYLDTGERTQEEIVGDLLRKIELFAKQQSISIINIRPGDVQENPVFHTYRTGLECEGTLKDVLAFMNLLEESDYLFQITKYSMVPKSKNGEIVTVNMDISRILITAEDMVFAA